MEYSSHSSQSFWCRTRRVRTLVLCSLLGFAASTINVSCSSMNRSPSSGYNDGSSARNRDAGRDANDEESDSSTRGKLARAEKELEGRREREQYFRNKPYMKNDHDRLEFLSLDTYEARQRWMITNSVQASAPLYSPQIHTLIEANDIAVGMPKQAVKDSWGEPEAVEVAGNPIYGNERWHYSEQTSSTEGYHSQSRVVYFESGRVVGWETR